MRASCLTLGLVLAGCHGGVPHGFASFDAGPMLHPSAALATAFFERVPQYYSSGFATFYDRDVSCGSVPRCGYSGASVTLNRALDGGALPLVAGDYPVLPSTPGGDAGAGIEVRSAVLTAFTITASSKGAVEGTGPERGSELGCTYYVTSQGDGGTVTVLDGGTALSAVIDANMVPPAFTYGGYPVYTGEWKGRFDAELCP